MRARVVASLLGCLVLLTLTTVVSPQPQRPVPTVGVLNYAAPHDVRVVQFIEAFRELGYVEGRNLTLVQRHADGILDRLPGLAAELVAAKVDVIIALGPAVWAAKQATTAIPIIIAFSGNPETQGVVASLARPGETLPVSLTCLPTWPENGLSCFAAHSRHADGSPFFTTLRSRRRHWRWKKLRLLPVVSG